MNAIEAAPAEAFGRCRWLWDMQTAMPYVYDPHTGRVNPVDPRQALAADESLQACAALIAAVQRCRNNNTPVPEDVLVANAKARIAVARAMGPDWIVAP